MKDYFKILGVEPAASDDAVKKAYRSLAMKHHPDRAGGDSIQFKEIQEAYNVLSDPQKRSEWEQAQHGNPFSGGFHFNFGGNPVDVNDIFRQFNAGQDPFGGFRQAQPLRKNRDLRIAIELALSSTLEPQVKHITISHLNGRKETVSVDVPRGIGPNMQMKYVGHGDRSYADLAPGDLYIDFKIAPSSDFVVEGIDLIKMVNLNCIDAITGTEITIVGIDGKTFAWTMPSGTQPDSRFRLSQQGLWAVNHPIRGNLFIHVKITVPNTISEKQLENLKNSLEPK